MKNMLSARVTTYHNKNKIKMQKKYCELLEFIGNEV